jgi:tetratricopeptide (TPR) repeat protein
MRICYKALTLTSVLFLSLTAVNGQSKYDKAYNKAEAAYVSGDYKSAESALEKFYSKASSKLGKQNKYTPTYTFSKAKYALASGLLFDFETQVGEAIKQSITLSSEGSQGHAQMLLDVAELYIQNGSFKTALEYWINLQRFLKPAILRMKVH